MGFFRGSSRPSSEEAILEVNYKDKWPDNVPLLMQTTSPQSFRFGMARRFWNKTRGILLLLIGLVLFTLWRQPEYGYGRYFGGPHGRLSVGSSDALVDTFASYKYHDSGCSIASSQLYVPTSQLCSDKLSVLEAMSSGGRIGRDAPYMSRGCDMHWFTTTEACRVLGRFSQILLVGDSMLRHVIGALNVLIREDLGYGGVTDWNFNEDERRQCFCNNQFDVRGCSVQGIYSTSDVLRNDPLSVKCPNLVPGWSTDLRIEEIVRYPVPDEELERLESVIDSNPSKTRALVFGHGLWNNLDIAASASWLDSVLKSIDPNKEESLRFGQFRPGPPMLLLTPNAAGEKKPDEWVVSQGNKALVRFEHEMAAEARSRGIDHLGTWNMSIQARLYDGVHMDMRGNLIKAMMVLNWLDSLQL